MLHIRTKISNLQYTNTKLSSILTKKFSSITQTITLNMKPQQNTKRPTCPNCSKPLSLCLCTRFKTQNLDNKVHVTILQHSLEIKHPLNSAKIARLGLKNVDVYTVTDVMFEAQLDIQQLGEENGGNMLEVECTSSVCGNAHENFDCEEVLGVKKSQIGGFDQVSDNDSGGGCVGVLDSQQFSGCLQESFEEIVDFRGDGAVENKENHLLKQSDAEIISTCDGLMSKDATIENGDKPLLSVTMGKSGYISNIIHQCKLQDDKSEPNNLDHLICKPEFMESFAKGFVVKKLQQKKKNGCIELEQFEEFRITVPPASALLFPAQNAVTAEAVNFEVKNLIVLDGTWSKANRMYNENPWLKLLPSVRLDVEKMSIFSEVRREPKPGYLSTVESIVYALQALGGSEKLAGLNNLLEVFESMVEDQRRFKDERLKKDFHCDVS